MVLAALVPHQPWFGPNDTRIDFNEVWQGLIEGLEVRDRQSLAELLEQLQVQRQAQLVPGLEAEMRRLGSGNHGNRRNVDYSKLAVWVFYLPREITDAYLRQLRSPVAPADAATDAALPSGIVHVNNTTTDKASDSSSLSGSGSSMDTKESMSTGSSAA